MDRATDKFLTKLDAFAAELTPTERAMLHALLRDEDDTIGFNFEQQWPGSRNLLTPLKIAVFDDISGTDLGSGRIARSDGTMRVTDSISGTDLGSSR